VWKKLTSRRTHNAGNQNAAFAAALVIAPISPSCVTLSGNSAANRLTAGCHETDKKRTLSECYGLRLLNLHFLAFPFKRAIIPYFARRFLVSLKL
jgi:hypothetical protein